jgi:hypothetical protein
MMTIDSKFQRRQHRKSVVICRNKVKASSYRYDKSLLLVAIVYTYCIYSRNLRGGIHLSYRIFLFPALYTALLWGGE